MESMYVDPFVLRVLISLTPLEDCLSLVTASRLRYITHCEQKTNDFLQEKVRKQVK